MWWVSYRHSYACIQSKPTMFRHPLKFSSATCSFALSSFILSSSSGSNATGHGTPSSQKPPPYFRCLYQHSFRRVPVISKRRKINVDMGSDNPSWCISPCFWRSASGRGGSGRAFRPARPCSPAVRVGWEPARPGHRSSGNDLVYQRRETWVRSWCVANRAGPRFSTV